MRVAWYNATAVRNKKWRNKKRTSINIFEKVSTFYKIEIAL